jgi:3-isopropylmalate/(R)-2-methylmalate dehydratase small subunit
VSAPVAASFSTLTSRVVALPASDVDTDQIIPARFLKVTERKGLGQHLFADWRADPAFVLNRPEAKAAQVLLAGHNFGCGSSREHAPWALCDFGFRAIISTSFADIFKGNSLKNGLLPIVVDAATHAAIGVAIASDPAATVSIDLEAQTLTIPGGRAVAFSIDPFMRTMLLAGTDELGYLLARADAITKYERDHA